MNKFGALITLLAIVVASCTSGSKEEADKENDPLLMEEEAVIDSHTSEISLDWAGVYEGTLPCASCERIEAVVELNQDHTYTSTFTYIGEPEGEVEFKEEGAFTWDETGSNITLESESEPTQYKVGENKLIMLTRDGEINRGELADMYVLKKKM